MVQQMTTALSDAVLALSAFNACLRLVSTNMCATAGFLNIGIAASFGVRRFGSNNPSTKLIDYHQYSSWSSTVFGMSAIAAGYYKLNFINQVANVHLAAGIAVVIMRPYLTSKILELATTIVSTFAVLSMLILCLLTFNPHGIIGSVVYVVAGIVIGTTGNWYGIPRVDIFHYALVVGNVALMMGLNGAQSPIFYSSSS